MIASRAYLQQTYLPPAQATRGAGWSSSTSRQKDATEASACACRPPPPASRWSPPGTLISRVDVPWTPCSLFPSSGPPHRLPSPFSSLAENRRSADEGTTRPPCPVHLATLSKSIDEFFFVEVHDQFSPSRARVDARTKNSPPEPRDPDEEFVAVTTPLLSPL